jgi:hypothetical protein
MLRYPGYMSRGPTQYDRQTVTSKVCCSSAFTHCQPKNNRTIGFITTDDNSVRRPRFVLLRTTLRCQRREVPSVITAVALGRARQDRRTEGTTYVFGRLTALPHWERALRVHAAFTKLLRQFTSSLSLAVSTLALRPHDI